MSILKWLDKNFEYTALSVFLAVLTVFSFLNVVLRYAFGSAILWSDEVCRYALVLSGFFSIPCWLRYKNGLRVDALVILLPKSVQRALEHIVSALLLALFAYLTYGTWLAIKNALKINLLSPTLRFPLAYLYTFIAFAFVLSCVRLLQGVFHRDAARAENGADGKEAGQ